MTTDERRDFYYKFNRELDDLLLLIRVHELGKVNKQDVYDQVVKVQHLLAEIEIEYGE